MCALALQKNNNQPAANKPQQDPVTEVELMNLTPKETQGKFFIINVENNSKLSRTEILRRANMLNDAMEAVAVINPKLKEIFNRKSLSILCCPDFQTEVEGSKDLSHFKLTDEQKNSKFIVLTAADRGDVTKSGYTKILVKPEVFKNPYDLMGVLVKGLNKATLPEHSAEIGKKVQQNDQTSLDKYNSGLKSDLTKLNNYLTENLKSLDLYYPENFSLEKLKKLRKIN